MAKMAGTSGQGSTAEPRAAAAAAPGVDANDPFGVAGWMRDTMPGVPMHPLVAHQVAAVAAATAFGFGMTGMMLGAVQGAMETWQKGATGLTKAEDVPMATSAASVAKGVATAKPVKARPKAARPVLTVVEASAPVAGTDLKQISGIGPKLEQALNKLGILSVSDVAGLSAAKVTKVDEQLGLGGRIARDDWVGQAKRLVQV